MERQTRFPLRQAARIPNNLPQPGEFIGRGREKAEVWEALASRWPLICIDGIGGIGKTALALEAAHECLRASKGEIPADDIPTFDAFVWTTAKDRELALSDILDAIARTLDYPYIAQLLPKEKWSEAAKLLRTQRCLLIVDNFETITDDTVRDFLLTLPEPSKVLITSREQKLRQARAISLRAMEQGEALALIRNEGKRLGLPAVEGAEEKVLLRLYEATGGTPLAIKWAVGQMKQRGQSLDTVLDYLYEARGDIFENIFARSWGLLSENARCVLMVMPIFATSASKPAIEAASDVHKWDLDEALGQLVEMWLVEASEELDEAKRRYSIHPLTRAFAGARLGEDKGWERGTRLRGAEYLVDFAGAHSGEGSQNYDELEKERENTLKAMDWCYSEGEWKVVVQVMDAVGDFLGVRGYGYDRLNYGRKAMVASEKLNDWKQWAWFAIFDVGWEEYKHGDLLAARDLTERAKRLCETNAYQRDLALALRNLGVFASIEGKYEDAYCLYKKSLTLWQQLGEWKWAAATRRSIGHVARQQGDYREAALCYTAALEDYERLGDEEREGPALVQYGFARIAHQQGKYEQAKQLYTESLAVFEKLGRWETIALCKQRLGEINEHRKNYDQALRFAREALELYESLGMKRQNAQTRQLVERLETRIAEARK